MTGSAVCLICGRDFTRKQNLRQHLRIHTGVKPFQCDTCGRRFTQKSTLRRHNMIHTNEKPHKCSTCSAAFTRKVDLENHMRIHTGERPYVCDFPGCGHACGTSKNLKSHKLNHRQASFECKLCGKVYVHRGSLRVHMRTKHSAPY